VVADTWSNAGRETTGPGPAFVLGGDYVLENLAAIDAVQSMQYRGYIATRLVGIPDKSKVKLVFVKGTTADDDRAKR
jgi:hypothetical protein